MRSIIFIDSYLKSCYFFACLPPSHPEPLCIPYILINLQSHNSRRIITYALSRKKLQTNTFNPSRLIVFRTLSQQ